MKRCMIIVRDLKSQLLFQGLGIWVTEVGAALPSRVILRQLNKRPMTCLSFANT